jgi:hypothetical protein
MCAAWQIASWLPATLTGGLAGSVLTLGGQALVRHCARPRLQIRFGADLSGCIVNTPEDGGQQNIQQRYLRLRIENVGRTFAKNTSVCVTRIDFTAAGTGTHTFSEEVNELRLSRSDAATPSTFNLAAGGHQFVDLVHTQQEQGKAVVLIFDFFRAAGRLTRLGYGPGQYQMTVFVAAENCQSVTRTVKWSFDGTLRGLTII